MSRLIGPWSLWSVVALVGSFAMPLPAAAQSGIAGVVTDTTGAVLPGVTVEARSPALIEQAKSAVSDANGQYRIIELRPGSYSVTFTLPGFSTVVREGIELEANFTAPINVQMKPGAIEETVTVTGASPVVDVQSTMRREVVSRELIDVLPQGRNYASILATLPGVRSGEFDVGGSEQTQQFASSAYGGQADDMAFMVDGMNSGTASLNAQGQYLDQGAIQDYDVRASGGNAEMQSPGINMNIVPREGGNQYSGQGVVLWSHPELQSDNLTDDLQSAGVRGAPKADRVYDYALNVGGPIFRDRLWFFGTARTYTFDKTVTNMFHDGIIAPAGTPVVDSSTNKDVSLRLTGQVTPTNKLTVYYDRNFKTLDYRSVGATFSTGLLRPEAAPVQTTPLSYILQAKWNSTLSNRLLLQAGWSRNNYGFYESLRPENRSPEELPPYGDIAKQELSTGLRYGAPYQFTHRNRVNQQFLASLTFVTGTHNLKGGVTYWPRGSTENVNSNAAVVQRYRNGQPNSVILYNTPVYAKTQYARDWGLYIQDSWTLGRLTLNPGVRWDYDRTYNPAQESPAGRWVPARSYPFKYNLSSAWMDVQPRFGAAFDLLGTGKTVVKGNVGWYVSQAGQPFYNDLVASTDTRNWTDLNGDDIAEGNELGPQQNLLFGIRNNTNPDQDMRRPGQRLYSLAIEHELLPRVGVSVTYTRRTYSDVMWTDNLATTFDDYTELSVADPRGNGEMLPIYNLSAAKLGQVDNLQATSNRNTRVFNGIDFAFRGELPNGAQFQGGASSGRDISVSCEVDDPNALRFCDWGAYDYPFRTRFRVSGTYPLPWDLRLSAVYQNLDGNERVITYPVTRTQLPALTASSLSVRLNEPGSTYLDRIQQLDISIAKSFRQGRFQFRPELDLFNALNASPILTRQDTFGPDLDKPLTILMGRLVRLGLKIDF